MTNSPPHLDAAAIQALVAEVIRRIGTLPPTPTPPAAPSHAPAPSQPPAHMLADRVITLASIERLPAGVRTVAIAAGAVVTPSASDCLRDRGLTLIRAAATIAGVAARPFVIGQAACSRDAATRTAAIARAVPGAQQLPASGLADVIAAMASHASKDAARGVLLTGTPAVAVVLANRSASLRAVTARDAGSLMAAATAAAANLLVVDPATFTGGSLERLCGEFHRSAAPPIPPELAVAPAGCGCNSHAH